MSAITVDNGGLADYDVAVDLDGAGDGHQKVKIEFGPDGTQTPVSAANPLPVTVTDGSGPITVDGSVTVSNPTPTQTQDAVYAPGPLVVVGGLRDDGDTSPVSASGDVHPFLFNGVGRLKVSAMPGIYTATTGTITASGQTVSVNVERASNVMFFMVATSLVGHNCTFEGSIDGGVNWFVVQAVRSNANTIETTTGVLAATPTYAWEASVNALTNFRVRATAHTSGVAAWRILPGAYATEPIPAAQVTATQPVSGTVTATGVAGVAAHDAAISGNPVRMAGRALSANYATVATGDTADLVTSLVGALVITPYAIPDLYWQATTTLTTTADVALQALLAGNRRCLTSWTVQNTGANVTTFQIKDGTTVIWSCSLPASMAQPQLFQLVNPLRTSAGAALNVATTVASNVIVNAQGYTAP